MTGWLNFAGWLGIILILDVPNFLYITYDTINGCANLDYGNPSSTPLRWYTFSWSIVSYPVALVFALGFNAAAVLRLRAQSRLQISTDEKNGHRSDTFAKRKAAIGLQRASIALAFTFAITSGPFQVTNTMQAVMGTHIILIYDLKHHI